MGAHQRQRAQTVRPARVSPVRRRAVTHGCGGVEVPLAPRSGWPELRVDANIVRKVCATDGMRRGTWWWRWPGRASSPRLRAQGARDPVEGTRHGACAGEVSARTPACACPRRRPQRRLRHHVDSSIRGGGPAPGREPALQRRRRWCCARWRHRCSRAASHGPARGWSAGRTRRCDGLTARRVKVALLAEARWPQRYRAPLISVTNGDSVRCTDASDMARRGGPRGVAHGDRGLIPAPKRLRTPWPPGAPARRHRGRAGGGASTGDRGETRRRGRMSSPQRSHRPPARLRAADSPPLVACYDAVGTDRYCAPQLAAPRVRGRPARRPRRKGSTCGPSTASASASPPTNLIPRGARAPRDGYHEFVTVCRRCRCRRGDAGFSAPRAADRPHGAAG